MGIGFVILFWFTVGCILLTTYLALWFLGRRYPTAALLKKVMLVGFCAIAIPLALIVVGNVALGFLPSHVFKSSFGFSPPADVVELRGRRFLFADGGDAYLRFRASKETVDRIVDSRFDEVVGDETKCNNFFGAEPIPTDWQPPEGKSVHCFRSGSRKDSFASRFGSDRASLLYDQQTGTVYFYWSGID